MLVLLRSLLETNEVCCDKEESLGFLRVEIWTVVSEIEASFGERLLIMWDGERESLEVEMIFEGWM